MDFNENGYEHPVAWRMKKSQRWTILSLLTNWSSAEID
jgi:hypothetical protein